MNNTYFDNKIKNTCNGCGVCALLCPTKCIKMVEDEEGFLYPEIDKTKCIECNICRKKCANFNNKKDEDEKAYVAINNSTEELKYSSSGGMFYLLAKYVLNKKGVVFGVTYNKEMEVVHEYAETLEDAKKFCGSKYVRSNLKDSYIKVENFLKNGRYVLFTGTACQISGLKTYLKEDYKNLILCDILCHANPSPKLFKMYIKNIEELKRKKVGKIFFRTKENGWNNQASVIEYEDGERQQESSYYKAFVSELINRPSCNKCEFASKRRIADFTIADFWGIEKIFPDIKTEQGVSLITVNNSYATDIFNEIKSEMFVKEVNYDVACSHNHYGNVKVNYNREKFFQKISNGNINENNIIKYMKKYSNKPIHIRIIKKIIKLCKKMTKRIITFDKYN